MHTYFNNNKKIVKMAVTSGQMEKAWQ